MSRAVWIDSGNDADYAKLRTYKIDRPYYAVTDPRVTKQYLETVRSLGFQPGIYSAWNWYPTDSGKQYAERLSAQCAPLFKSTAPDFPRVCVDIETHDVGYILAFLKRWRELRPQRATDWTLEGFQGGLFSPTDRIHIAAAHVGVVPQAYSGDMQPFDAVAVAIDLCAWGFPPSVVSIFYDAARLPANWSGYAFTQGRLP